MLIRVIRVNLRLIFVESAIGNRFESSNRESQAELNPNSRAVSLLKHCLEQLYDSRFTIHEYGGEQEKRPCGLFYAAHLLVQDREKGETIPLTKVIYSKAQWLPDSRFKTKSPRIGNRQLSLAKEPSKLNWQSPIGNRQTLNLLFVNLAAMVYTPAVVPSLPKNTRFRRVPPCHNLSAGSCVSTITKIRQTCSPCSFLRRTMTLFAR